MYGGTMLTVTPSLATPRVVSGVVPALALLLPVPSMLRNEPLAPAAVRVPLTVTAPAPRGAPAAPPVPRTSVLPRLITLPPVFVLPASRTTVPVPFVRLPVPLARDV